MSNDPMQPLPNIATHRGMARVNQSARALAKILYACQPFQIGIDPFAGSYTRNLADLLHDKAQIKATFKATGVIAQADSAFTHMDALIKGSEPHTDQILSHNSAEINDKLESNEPEKDAITETIHREFSLGTHHGSLQQQIIRKHMATLLNEKNYRPQVIYDSVLKLHQDLEKELKNKLSADQQKIKVLCRKGPPEGALYTQLTQAGLTEQEIKTFEKNMHQQMTQQHQEAAQKYQEEMKTNLEAFDTEINKAEAEYRILCAQWRQASEEGRRELEENATPNPSVTLSNQAATQQTINLKNLDTLFKEGDITLLSGLSAHYNKDSKSFNMELPSSLDPFLPYYSDNDDQLLADFEHMAAMNRAIGHETATFKITLPSPYKTDKEQNRESPGELDERARRTLATAYQALLNQKYTPKSIKFELNGKSIDPGDFLAPKEASQKQEESEHLKQRRTIDRQQKDKSASAEFKSDLAAKINTATAASRPRPSPRPIGVEEEVQGMRGPGGGGPGVNN